MDDDEKIRLAAAEPNALRDHRAAMRRIIRIGVAAERAAASDGDANRRIRLAAGYAAENSMLKATIGAPNALEQKTASILQRGSSPAKVGTRRSASTTKFEAPPAPRRLAPSPVRPAPAPIPLPPLPVIGPGQVEHDGIAAILGRYAFRDRLAADVRPGTVSGMPEHIIRHAAEHFGLGPADAAELAEWFLSHLQRDVRRRATDRVRRPAP